MPSSARSLLLFRGLIVKDRKTKQGSLSKALPVSIMKLIN